MDKEQIEIIGDNHISTNIETPLHPEAFEKSDTEKIHNIKKYFAKIMEELGLDLSDDSLSGTPYRFAKMYVKDLFLGLTQRINQNFQHLKINMATKKCWLSRILILIHLASIIFSQ